MLPPQRDDVAGLRGRLEAIDAELDDVRNQARRLDALEREKARLEAERAELASRLGAYGQRVELEDLRVASPCKADWAKMVGNEQVRFCSSCQKNVYNLSGMTRDEADALVRQNEGGELCVRMYRRADDTVLTSDCPEGARRKRRRLAILSAGGGVMAAAAAATASVWSTPATCKLDPNAPATMGSAPVSVPAVMGTVAAPRPALPAGDAPQPGEATQPKAEGEVPRGGPHVLGRMPIRRVVPGTSTAAIDPSARPKPPPRAK